MAISDVTSSSLWGDLNIDKKKETVTPSNELGKDAFLELMITQLKNQNPLEPQANAEFVAQLAQFSSLEGIQQLNDSVETLVGSNQSNQALQASALVGRTVKIETDYAYLPQDGRIYGTLDLPASTSGIQLNVYDSKGSLVFSEDLGAQEAGDLAFAWDGKLADGTEAPAGGYQFEAIATVNGKPTELTTYLGANVNSVTLGPNNTMTLNVAGVGPVTLSDIKEIL